KIQADLQKALERTGGRKCEWDTESADLHAAKTFTIADLSERMPRTDEEREVADLADNAFIISKLLNRAPRETKYLRQQYNDNAYFRRAFDLSGGADWIPTEFSASMHAAVVQQMQVVNLIENVQMPSASYVLPVEGSD